MLYKINLSLHNIKTLELKTTMHTAYCILVLVKYLQYIQGIVVLGNLAHGGVASCS